MASYKVVVLAGDGVGPEIIREGMKVIRAAMEATSLEAEFTELEIGAGRYRRTGSAFSDADIQQVRKADAVYFGAVGLPEVRLPDGREVQAGYNYRRDLDLYANIRPVKLYAGVDSPLKNAQEKGIDYVVFRENTEGLYTFGQGGFRIGNEAAVNPLIISRKGTERIARAAFLAARRRDGAPEDGVKRVTCVHKSNVVEAYAFFQEVFNEVAREFPDIKSEHYYTDAMTVQMVQRPWHFDVVVTENMFGDILSDLGAGTIGSLGLAPSAEVGDRHGLFQSIHGSAPDIAGKGIVNPIAAILSGAMMLDWLGTKNNDPKAAEAGRQIEKAVEIVLAEGEIRTPDLGGKSTTVEIGDAIIREMKT
ncbi:MAG TPA: isocitrate/isopropylmalate dehydrogenase family protein [Thermodesulfobacteriota bacterium]|nr:isocitrate/isopropylmalate dehydrogenase family protein [Thermodesulfobacteriota bacterium]